MATPRATDEYNRGSLIIGESGANTLISFPSESSEVSSASIPPSDSLS